MSRCVERKCPACGQVSAFRVDQKTCGCARRKSQAKPEGLSVDDVLSRLAKSETKLQKVRLELQAERKQNKFLKTNVLWTPDDIAKIRDAAGHFQFPIKPVKLLKADHVSLADGSQ